MLFQGGFSFSNFIADLWTVFIFALWLWLLIVITRDLFRRIDISGAGKLLWVLLMILLPYIGVFAYLLTQGRGMGERDRQRQRERDEGGHFATYSVADELEKLLRLKNSGAISEQEFARLREKMMR